MRSESKKGKAVIIGAGRSGRGMLGEMYHRDGFEITFADVDRDLVDGLREQGWYTVRMTNLKSGNFEECRIEGFRILHAEYEKEAYLDALSEADLVSTALLPEDFDAVISDLARAVAWRRKKGVERLLFVTLGANYVGLYEYFDRRLRALLSGEELNYFKRWIRLVMSVVNRKNLLPELEEQKGDPFRIVGDDKNVLRVEESEELAACPFLPAFFRLEKNLGAAMAIKIWSGNLVQCSMAFVALRDGITDTYRASYHETAAKYAYYAAAEGYAAVAAEYGLKPRNSEEKKTPVTIFRNPKFKDSLYRIARDPIRKLGRNDRFIGPALCCTRHDILPYYITKCCAYAFLYHRSEEPQSEELHDFIKENGIEAAIRTFCELDVSVENERIVYELILNAYREIDGTDPLKADII